MGELYDAYEAFAKATEEAKSSLPTVGDRISDIFEEMIQNNLEIGNSPISEIFRPIPMEERSDADLIILRWGEKFEPTDEETRTIKQVDTNHKARNISGRYENKTPDLAIVGSNFRYIVAYVQNDSIPNLRIVGKKSDTPISVVNFLSDPMTSIVPGLYLALVNPVTYSSVINISNSGIRVNQEGQLCKQDGTLVPAEPITTALEKPKWNVFGRTNQYVSKA